MCEIRKRRYLANPQEGENRKGHKTDDKDGWSLIR